jgi:hypothetical protein
MTCTGAVNKVLLYFETLFRCRVPGTKMTHLGNVWNLPEPSNMRNPTTRQFTVRVKDMSGGYYPQSTIPFSCGSQRCPSDVEV